MYSLDVLLTYIPIVVCWDLGGKKSYVLAIYDIVYNVLFCFGLWICKPITYVNSFDVLVSIKKEVSAQIKPKNFVSEAKTAAAIYTFSQLARSYTS